MTFQSWWHFRRARFYLFLNKRTRAMAEYETVLAIDPSDAMAANALGYLHGENGNHEQAIEKFQSVLRLTPNDANTQFNLGYIRQKQARHDDAIALFASSVATA
jgi:tetratricopeptide (TPR) repeat protein